MPQTLCPYSVPFSGKQIIHWRQQFKLLWTQPQTHSKDTQIHPIFPIFFITQTVYLQYSLELYAILIGPNSFQMNFPLEWTEKLHWALAEPKAPAFRYIWSIKSPKAICAFPWAVSNPFYKLLWAFASLRATLAHIECCQCATSDTLHYIIRSLVQ